MRLSVDVGGTFTDLVLEDNEGDFHIFKQPTTPEDPVNGVLAVVGSAAEKRSVSQDELLASCDLFIHATTRATNAVLTNGTSRTAFLTSEGHPDVLLLREGGRIDPFDNTVPFPEPLVPRHLTFEVPERILADGRVLKPLDEDATVALFETMQGQDIAAIGVCLLWSIINPVHEKRVGALLDEHFPNVPYTLSHALNPSLREYRRASSTCIDASLKPVMTGYLNGLEGRLREAGFRGRLLSVTSQGSVMDATDLAASPIHSINSGPSMAPIAGRFYGRVESDIDTAIVADSGGTSYDVSLVRKGRIPWTRETWLGQRLRGHMTGFPSVDVRSIGAGGGSVAWVDSGGMLHVGPGSAGSVPGPVCYGQGGTEPTVTDAALALGYIDPEFFLGGAIKLDLDSAIHSIKTRVGDSLGLDTQATAAAIINVTSENMVQAIEDVTINQGIDPREAILIGGGGAAGLNAVQIARRLGCTEIIIPASAATLSATGALMSDLSTEYSQTWVSFSNRFDFDGVNSTLADLESRCKTFLEGRAVGEMVQSIDFSVEARYPHQVWEIEVPLTKTRFDEQSDVALLEKDFHQLHEEMFAIADRDSHVEVVSWRARARCALPARRGHVIKSLISGQIDSSRKIYFDGVGEVHAPAKLFENMEIGEPLRGPAIVESSFTTVVIDPEAVAIRTENGNLTISP